MIRVEYKDNGTDYGDTVIITGLGGLPLQIFVSSKHHARIECMRILKKEMARIEDFRKEIEKL